MRRFIPLLVVLLLVLALLALFGPSALGAYRLRQSVRGLLDAALREDRAAIAAVIESSQRQPFAELMDRHIPQDYSAQIESLRMVNYEIVEGRDAWVLVNCRVADASGAAIYQGRLHWQRDAQGQWLWDPAGSFAAPFSPSGEPSWIQLDALIRQAGGQW
jgi:hypothetical protein